MPLEKASVHRLLVVANPEQKKSRTKVLLIQAVPCLPLESVRAFFAGKAGGMLFRQVF